MARLYLLCAIVLGILVSLTLYYRSESDMFYGIADAKEIVVASESAVEIQRVPVMQGQLVKRGDTLLELRNPELELRISQISGELSELRARKTAHVSLTRSELMQLKAEQEEKASEIRVEIRELEAQYELNRELVSELRSLNRGRQAESAEGKEAKDPIQVKLESLRKLLELTQDPARVYEKRLEDALTTSGDPYDEQVARLEDELRILKQDREQLINLSQIDGVIGSVNFKAGEKVSPFTPILTVHAASPSYVRGYIHEEVYSQIQVGQEVRVRSSQDRKHAVEGRVVGVGTRIVEYPERLRKRPDIIIWGREFLIRLPEENRFLLGEKVMIELGVSPVAQSPTKTAAMTSDTGEILAASVGSSRAVVASPQAGVALEGAVDVPGLEASGLVFFPDRNRFLVVSDDNPKKRPLLHWVASDGRIDSASSIRGLEKMDDMEAISSDGSPDGPIWVLSSQSHNKKGNLPEARKLLVKAGLTANGLVLRDRVALFDVLAELARAHADSDWGKFLARGIADASLDIEGMAVEDGAVYLGFKAPLLNGNAVVLRLDGADSLVAGRKPAPEDVSIWKALNLKDKMLGISCGIADMVFVKGDLWLLSTGDEEGHGKDARHAGELWVLRRGAANPERMREFRGAKPEGLAYHAPSKGFYVAFDNGSDRPSQLLAVGGGR